MAGIGPVADGPLLAYGLVQTDRQLTAHKQTVRLYLSTATGYCGA